MMLHVHQLQFLKKRDQPYQLPGKMHDWLSAGFQKRREKRANIRKINFIKIVTLIMTYLIVYIDIIFQTGMLSIQNNDFSPEDAISI